jgi:hypothetical protein
MKKTCIITAVLLLPFLSGCFSTSNYFNGLRSDILRSLKGDFSRDTEFSIGPVGISMAGWFISEEEDPVAAGILEDISRVEVGVYKRNSGDQEMSNYQVLKRIDRRMNKNGWKYFVKNCSKEEFSAVYVNENLENGITKMFIVSLDSNELVLVQLDGNLSRVFETAIQERGLSYN